MGFKHKGSTDFQKSTILSFSYPILLWCIWTGSLVNDSMSGEEIFHMLVYVFSPIVRSKNLRLSLKLGNNYIIKFNKSIKYFKFVFQEIHPAHLSTIINK